MSDTREGDRSRDGGRAAAIGFLAHTGWAVLVVVAGGVPRPEVVFRGRVELADPSGRVRKNVYHVARALDPVEAADLVEAGRRAAADQAAVAVEQTLGRADDEGVAVHSCAVVVGAPRGDVPLETILRSHALVHAAEGRLYQGALLEGAESRGLAAVAVPKQSIWEQAEAELGVDREELRRWISFGESSGRPGHSTRSSRPWPRGSRSPDCPELDVCCCLRRRCGTTCLLLTGT